MSKVVEQFTRKMAENLEFRSRYPASDVWPSPLADITLANDITGEYFLDVLFSIFSSTYSIIDISESFYRPSRIVYLMYLFTLTPKTQEIANKRNWLAEKMLDCISYLRCGDPFMRKGINTIVHYESALHKYELMPIDNEQKLILKKILVALAIINEYLYFAWMGIGRENHGVYRINKDRLLVKEYYDLKPPFWSFSSKLLYSSYTVIADVPELTTPKFDFNGRVHFDGAVDITKACILLDGRQCQMSIDCLNKIYENLKEVIMSAKDLVKSMSGNDLLLKFGEAQNFAVKESVKRLGLSIPYELPIEIRHSLLNASGKSSNTFMLQRLHDVEDQESRVRIIQDFIMPSNMKK